MIHVVTLKLSNLTERLVRLVAMDVAPIFPPVNAEKFADVKVLAPSSMLKSLNLIKLLLIVKLGDFINELLNSV